MGQIVLDLKLHLIQDVPTREALKALVKFLDEREFLSGKWAFLDLTFDRAVASFRYSHGLGIVPKDFIQTSLSGVGTVTINWQNSDRQYLDMTATGPCVVRGFIGAHA